LENNCPGNGNHLKASGRTTAAPGQIAVAINHVPLTSLEPPEKSDSVSFELPAHMPNAFTSAEGNLWLSLVINGVETNALPFSILKANGQPLAAGETNTAPQEK
jgi:hypothetical protein